MEEFVGFIIAVGLAIFVFSSGIKAGADSIRKEAAKLGHAEFYLDEKAERQWRWKDIKKCEN